MESRIFYVSTNSAACKQWQFYFFLFKLYSFYFFLFSYWYDWDLNNFLNTSGESRHPCLIPDLRGIVCRFLTISILAAGLSLTAFMLLSYCPSIPTFLKVFNMNGGRIWLKALYCLDVYIIFILQFVNLVYHIDWFATHWQLCNTGINVTYHLVWYFWDTVEFC